DSGEEQVADVLLCGDAKHDERNRWRNEDAQRSRGGYEARGEFLRISVFHHCRDHQRPTATTVAGDDPETAAKNMQASTVVIAIPPRRWPTMAAPKSVRRREIPPRDMMFAARMKNGIAISGNELSALNRRSETWDI